jgi:hypothetical protein
MQPQAQLQADVAHGVADRLCAADRLGRPVEASEKPVPGGVEFHVAEPGQLCADPPMVGGQQLPPSPFAEFSRPCGRADNVEKLDGRRFLMVVVLVGAGPLTYQFCRLSSATYLLTV